jgi:hypothetical protein
MSPREKALIRLLESVAGRRLSTLEKIDARAFIIGGPGRDGVQLCECEGYTLAECRAAGNCS